MKDFINLKNLKMASGFATGFLLYDYFVHGELNWIAAIVTAIILAALMPLFYKNKK
ncbi:Hypothetical protein I595_3297 [Croceitalea dokdonensis DOKDO 023]|uniref:Uncharacterized protein n=1 Tax=Croceitalea dokdonensis DOKDO 023 TaxID=1300341 RepID=A0A0P7AS80_9FLAO|nr:hypothetical protein [Croceitalea dokdonensis]KPM30800.1 Hypothetical protein I595_3297 [Croceitalea dokdonensis DOKDO 023]